jgi:hypothetical protein
MLAVSASNSRASVGAVAARGSSGTSVAVARLHGLQRFAGKQIAAHQAKRTTQTITAAASR